MGSVIETNPQNLFTTTNVVKKLDSKRTLLNGELVKPNGDPNGIRVNYFRAPEMISEADEVTNYEYGMFVGKVLTDNEKVIIIDDVMTSGKALRESMPKLKSAADVDVTGMVITVDRQEKGTGELSAVQEVKRDFGVTVYPSRYNKRFRLRFKYVNYSKPAYFLCNNRLVFSFDKIGFVFNKLGIIKQGVDIFATHHTHSNAI